MLKHSTLLQVSNDWLRANYRLVCVLGGIALLLLGFFLPTEWYEHLPRAQEDLPAPPLKGVTLVRICFGIEGAALCLLGWIGRFGFSPDLNTCRQRSEPIGGDLRFTPIWLAMATLLAAALRLYKISSDLWIDEVFNILEYRNQSAFHVLTAYTASNNHLLNTLLVKGAVVLFGLHEWSIRLPAVLAGVASIPTLYFLARFVLGRRESVLAAFLLAVSYHHIFFSQNARGYSALLLWGMVGTIFFLRAMHENRPIDWTLYVGSMVVCIAFVLYGFFVVVGHCIGLLTFCWLQWRKKESPLPTVRRALVALAVLAMLCFHIYASVIPQFYVYVITVYKSKAVGFEAFSIEHLLAWVHGISAGYGGGAIAGGLVAVAMMGCGFVGVLRRYPLYSVTLIAPLVATGVFLLVMRFQITPRAFLWGLVAAPIFTVGAAFSFARLILASRPQATALITFVGFGLIFLLSVNSLRSYYRAPKQPTRESLEWVLQHKQPEHVLVAAYLAEWGLRFYGPPRGLQEGQSFFVARSVEDLQNVEQEQPSKTIWLLTTFPRFLKIEHPALNSYIADHYRILESFSATVADADITLWERVQDSPATFDESSH